MLIISIIAINLPTYLQIHNYKEKLNLAKWKQICTYINIILYS